MPDFAALSAPVLFAIFFAAAALVWVSGTRLAVLGDEMSERWNLAKEFVGLIFLATISKFPEIVTTVTAAGLERPGLVLGGLYGSIPFNTAILAVADIFVVRRALTSWPRNPAHALIAVMLVVLLGATLAIMMLGDIAVFGAMGLGGACLALCFPAVIGMQRAFSKTASWAPVDLPDDTDHGIVLRDRSALQGISSANLIGKIALSCVEILIGGLVLTYAAEALADTTGLGGSFVGVTLLAAATSMPEFSTTIAAARIGAYTMALANIFGSNLMTIALIPLADIVYASGPILNGASGAVQFSIAIGIMVTAIYVAGILIRRTPSILGAGLDSWLVMVIYIGSLGGLYYLG